MIFKLHPIHYLSLFSEAISAHSFSKKNPDHTESDINITFFHLTKVKEVFDIAKRSAP